MLIYYYLAVSCMSSWYCFSYRSVWILLRALAGAGVLNKFVSPLINCVSLLNDPSAAEDRFVLYYLLGLILYLKGTFYSLSFIILLISIRFPWLLFISFREPTCSRVLLNGKFLPFARASRLFVCADSLSLFLPLSFISLDAPGVL